jgi:uncharacterized protein
LKILAVSDMVVDQLYSEKVPERFGGIELILGCGDLPYEYLEFLVSVLNVPLYYVPGNHDPGFDERKPATQAQGCINLDRDLEHFKGLTLAGLGGSIRYKPNSPNQYTQIEMYYRILSFAPTLLMNSLRPSGHLDFLIAHSPPHGIHDEDDHAHIGFKAFNEFIHFFKPRYFLHGHTLVYKSNILPPVTQVGPTTVINVYPYRIFDI